MGEIVKKFIDAEMQLTKGALDFIQAQPNSDALVERVLDTLKSMEHRPYLITENDLKQILEEEGKGIKESHPPKQEVPPKPMELVHKKFKPVAAEHDVKVRVLRDISGKSYSRGRAEDFVKLFNSRFRKLSTILQKRVELENAISLSSLRGRSQGEEVSVIGMVMDKRRSQWGSIMIDLEDQTGKAQVIVRKNDRRLIQKADRVVTDEVIGVVGSIAPGKGPRVYARDILWPGTPIQREPRRSETPLCAAMISDLHVGSEQFLEELFQKFLRWLRGEVEKEAERDLASRVKFLIIAGDLVDGIGVYPEQSGELLITDIYRQYEAATKLLSEVPDHVEVIISPGNHDAARPPEPQPSISRDIAAPLYEQGYEMVGNPCTLLLDGVQFLVYHGRSFDDLVASVPGLTRHHPIQLMVDLLERRHLAPIYGGRTAISPEEEDLMVIDELPDVFHCGHVHRFGVEKHRGIWVVNSATFQAKTEYMRKIGVNPTPGYVPVLDLKTLEMRVMHFG